MKNKSIFVILFILVTSFSAFSQTTVFTYQGSLKDGATVANGNYDFEFALFDALSNGNQIGASLPFNNIAVANGLFSVGLDFGNQFPGANRYLAISVRNAGVGKLTTLTPRQLINSAPYSVKTLNADNAANTLSLGGVDASQYVQTGDIRLSDARNPLPNSSNYIQNGTSPQSSSSFNISGSGIVGTAWFCWASPFITS